MAYQSIVAAGLGLILLVSCKKNNTTEVPPDEPALPAYVIKSATHVASASVTYKYLYSFNAKAQATERQYFFPATATASSSSITYSYDVEGKLITTRNISTGNPNIYDEEYIYDLQDRLITRKTFVNTNPSGTSIYTYNGNTVIEDYAGLVKYTATLDNAGNIIKKIAEFTSDPTQNYIEEWLDHDDKPIINEAPPSAGHLHSKNNFHKSKLTFTDWDKQAYNKIYDYQYTFNADGYVTESKQYDSGTGTLLLTITYELIKP
ncbi:MAG: hypothetical protein ABI675_10435 [Chitinophagaceae bacterium]